MIVLFVFFVAILFFAGNEYLRWRAINTNIVEIQGHVDRVQKDNDRLVKRLDYIRSDAYVEYEAKRVLGYKNKSESVLVVPESIIDSKRSSDFVERSKNNVSSSEESFEVAQIDSSNEEVGVGSLFSLDNYKKWFAYFFY